MKFQLTKNTLSLSSPICTSATRGSSTMSPSKYQCNNVILLSEDGLILCPLCNVMPWRRRLQLGQRIPVSTSSKFAVARDVRRAMSGITGITAPEQSSEEPLRTLEKSLEILRQISVGTTPTTRITDNFLTNFQRIVEKERVNYQIALDFDTLRQLNRRRAGDAYVLQLLTGIRTSSENSHRQSQHYLTRDYLTAPPEELFRSIEALQFDSFKFNIMTASKPLSTLGFHILKTQGIVSTLNLDSDKLVQFLTLVEAGYTDVKYHNRIHATDVLQRVHAIIVTLSSDVFSLEDKLTCYLSAIIHDFGHAGVSNAFLIASRHELARRYNDKSPWENHHVSAAWELLMQNDANFLCNMPDDQVNSIRQNVITLVRATDMTKHIKWMKKFKEAAAPLGKLDESERKIMALCLALKAADIGHTTCEWQVHCRWVTALQEELYTQGDLEREMGIPMTAMTDRHAKVDLKASQVGFFDVVVLPLLSVLTVYFTGTMPLLKFAEDNRKRNKKISGDV